jgi:branched-chain amino acid transport system substrate-binding protein
MPRDADAAAGTFSLRRPATSLPPIAPADRLAAGRHMGANDQMRRQILLAAGALALAAAAPALAQPIRLADVAELSGPGASVGVLWKQGVEMAVDEINAKGGILGRKIELASYDTQTDPSVSRAQVQKALDGDPYAIVGPIFSGSVKVNMALAQAAGVPQFTGAAAPDIPATGNPWIFRTATSLQIMVPRTVDLMAGRVGARKIAIVYVNDDFGKAASAIFQKAAAAKGLTVVANLSTEAGQVDFTSDALKVKSSGADGIYLTLHEEENARFLKEARRQKLTAAIVGEGTTLHPKVIELAGDAANGVLGQVWLGPATPVPLLQDLTARYKAKYSMLPDHNAMQGYMIVYMIKVATEKAGKVDRKALGDTLHSISFDPKAEPGLLVESHFEPNGDLISDSFLGEIAGGTIRVLGSMPK